MGSSEARSRSKPLLPFSARDLPGACEHSFGLHVVHDESLVTLRVPHSGLDTSPDKSTCLWIVKCAAFCGRLAQDLCEAARG